MKSAGWDCLAQTEQAKTGIVLFPETNCAQNVIALSVPCSCCYLQLSVITYINI